MKTLNAQIHANENVKKMRLDDAAKRRQRLDRQRRQAHASQAPTTFVPLVSPTRKEG